VRAWRIWFFTALILGAAVPLLVLILYAFGSVWSFPQLTPQRLDLRSLHYVWDQRWDILLSMGSSLFYSLSAALLSMALCLWPAKLLAWHSFPGKPLIEGLLLAPALVPAMTFSMGVHYLFIIWGLTDTTLGVILVLTMFTYPYMLRALVSGYSTFGPEYYACARNLGAGPLCALFRVELPLLVPAVVAGGSLVFLISFSEYFLVFLIGGGSVPSYTGYLFPFLTSSDRSLASLLTLLFLVLPMLLFVLTDVLVMNSYRKKGMA
jgi:putative spermidine/putrescine transport system permease protein